MTGDLDMKKIAIPNNAVRCIIMTPKAKAGVNDIINQLHQFGDEPTVICGQYDDEPILAAAMNHKRVSILDMLDGGSTNNQNRKKARRLLFNDTKNQTMVVAYGHPGVINKALGSKNKSKIGVKDETMAGIVFISANGRVITADTMSIDIAA